MEKAKGSTDKRPICKCTPDARHTSSIGGERCQLSLAKAVKLITKGNKRGRSEVLKDN